MNEINFEETYILLKKESTLPIYEINSFLSRFLIWKNFGGRMWFYFIVIRKDMPIEWKTILIEHERYHYEKQVTRIGKFTYLWKYLTNRKFRLGIEREAYYFVDFLRYNRFKNLEEMDKYIDSLY